MNGKQPINIHKCASVVYVNVQVRSNSWHHKNGFVFYSKWTTAHWDYMGDDVKMFKLCFISHDVMLESLPYHGYYIRSEAANFCVHLYTSDGLPAQKSEDPYLTRSSYANIIQQRCFAP